MLLDALADGMTPADIVRHYPSVGEEDVCAAAAWAAHYDRLRANGAVFMSARAAEMVAARTAGAMLAETFIRSRTTPLLLLTGGSGLIAIVLAVLLGGVLGLLLGLVGLVLLGVATIAFLLRTGALAAVRKFAGGPDFAVARPIVQRHLAELRKHGERLPMGRLGVIRLLAMARRPAELQRQVLASGEAVAQSVPGLVTELRASLSGRDT